MSSIVVTTVCPSGFWRSRFKSRTYRRGFAIAEVLIAIGILSLAIVTATQALLHANRRAALSRVLNLAKAETLSRIQQVSQCAYSPAAVPPVIPSILTIGSSEQTVNLGSSATDLGSSATDLGNIPGKLTWTVNNSPGNIDVLSIRCAVTYQYLGVNQSYELFTYKSAD